VARKRVEVAVLGCGAAGSMALWRLASRGIPCVGFEQFEPGHDRGSSTGDTRIFRTAYFEGPGYVPLLLAALPLWRGLEAESGRDLLTLCGALMIGTEGGEVVAGARRSAEEHGLPHELLDAADLRRRYPQHAIGESDRGLLDGQGGFLRPELCVATAAQRARELGAALETDTRIEVVEPSPVGFLLRSAAGDEWEADRLVLAAGAWNPRWAPAVPLTVERVVQTWWPVADGAFTPDRFPAFIRQTESGISRYGIPTTDGATLKVAGHGGGGKADPDHLDRETSPGDWQGTAEFVRTSLLGVDPEVARARVCMYTNTPDEHFVIGEAPDLPGALLLSACSGHGFKFAPVLGEIAARWAAGESIPFDLDPFSPRRFAPVP
jgi:sarcosine oxidase